MNSKTEQERVLQLVADKKISAAEGELLLRRMSPKPVSIWTWLFDPLVPLKTPTALVASVVAVVASAFLGLAGVRFAGALDVKSSPQWPGLEVIILDAMTSWPLTGLLFFAAARLMGSRGRFVDFLAGVGLSRWPFMLCGVVAALMPTPEIPAPGKAPDPAIIVLALLTIPLVAWAITLLATGFRTASGLRGAKFVGPFVITLVLAEVMSRVLLSLI